jgi:hypothetical protein
VRLQVLDARQAQLPEVVRAAGHAGRFPGGLDRRQQQADQDADDGDHYQQLDQRKATPESL